MKYLFAVLSFMAFSCQTSSKHTEEPERSPADGTPLLAGPETCFLYTEGNEDQDSTFVSLQVNGDSVSGFMHWQPWQKDGAYGTISAKKEGDKIFGVYDYLIEGMEQSEEVIFKIIDGKLHKGSGELREKLGEEVVLLFKDTSAINYETAFKVIDCQDFIKY